MSFMNPIYGLKRFIYEKRPQTTAKEMNMIVAEAQKFQRKESYRGDILTPDIRRFITRLPEPIKTVSVDSLVDRLLPYTQVQSTNQRYNYNTDDGPRTDNTRRLDTRIGTSTKYVSFIPDFALQGTNQEKPDAHATLRELDGIYTDKGNIVIVSISRLEEALRADIFNKKLQALYSNVIESLPIIINLTSTRDKKNFLRKLNNLSSDAMEMRENFSLEPTTEEGQMEKFKKNWNTIKQRIRGLIPIGRVPNREILSSIARYLRNDYKLSLLAAPLFTVGSALEEDLEERVSERASSLTFGDYIFKAILQAEGVKAFQNISLDSDYSLEEREDSFFDRKPEIADNRQRIEQLALPKFNGKRFVFRSPNGDDIIYYSSGVITPEQVKRRLPESYELDREEIIDNVMEYQDKQRADAKREERLKRKLSTSDVGISEFYDNLDAYAEQLRRRESRGEYLSDRDSEGRAVSPSIQRFMPSKFYFHPFDSDVELDPELFKMKISELPEDERRRIKTFLQDAEPTEYFGEEYLKLTKLINTLADVVDSTEEEELEDMDVENLKLIKKLAHLRKRYENLYQEIYGMVYGEEE